MIAGRAHRRYQGPVEKAAVRVRNGLGRRGGRTPNAAGLRRRGGDSEYKRFQGLLSVIRICAGLFYRRQITVAGEENVIVLCLRLVGYW